MIGKTAIVVHAGNLECTKRNFSLLKIDFGVNSLRLKDGRGDGLHARDRARRGVDRAEIDRLSQLEEAWGEQCGLAIGQASATQYLQERLFDVTLEVIGIDADRKIDFERDVIRTFEFDVLSR